MTQLPSRLPYGYEFYARSPDFTPETLPERMRAGHSTKPGVWGLLRVSEGAVRYEVESPGRGSAVARSGEFVVIEAGATHHVDFVEPGRFHVEFYRAS